MAFLVIFGLTKLLWTLMIVDVEGYTVVRDDMPKRVKTEQTDGSHGQMDHKVMREVSAEGSVLEMISSHHHSSSTQVLLAFPSLPSCGEVTLPANVCYW